MHKVRQAIRKHRKLLSACAMVLAIALMFWAVNSPAIVGVSAAKRVLPIYSVQRDDRVVSLTFDAAWGNEDTQALIADGYTILPVSQMLLPGDTHIDPNGRQCPADADAGT